MSDLPSWHGTTILSVRKDGVVVIAGDGQVSLGDTVIKGNARKVRPLGDGSVIAGFAGATADGFINACPASVCDYGDGVIQVEKTMAEGQSHLSQANKADCRFAHMFMSLLKLLDRDGLHIVAPICQGTNS